MDKTPLYNICKDICTELGIETPKIDTTFKNSGKNNVFIQCVPHANTIMIDVALLTKSNALDMLLNLAHECRHLYQYQQAISGNNKVWKDNLDNYIESTGNNLTEYNLQPLELDANAWATHYMSQEYGVTPLFRGLDKKVVNAIKKESLKFKD